MAESRIATDDPRNTSVHVSGGVAALRPLTRDFNELMRHADAAMFKAKREGRNAIRAGFEYGALLQDALDRTSAFRLRSSRVFSAGKWFGQSGRAAWRERVCRYV